MSEREKIRDEKKILDTGSAASCDVKSSFKRFFRNILANFDKSLIFIVFPINYYYLINT